MITIGTKISQHGWVDIEEVERIPDIPSLHTVGLLVTETGASNVCNVLGNLKMLNGYKVRVTVAVLDTPDNRRDSEKLPRPTDSIVERHIADVLSNMEADGRFDRMSDDEKGTEQNRIREQIKQEATEHVDNG